MQWKPGQYCQGKMASEHPHKNKTNTYCKFVIVLVWLCAIGGKKEQLKEMLCLHSCCLLKSSIMTGTRVCIMHGLSCVVYFVTWFPNEFFVHGKHSSFLCLLLSNQIRVRAYQCFRKICGVVTGITYNTKVISKLLFYAVSF